MVCAIRAKLLVVSMVSDGVCADRAKLLFVSMASDGVCVLVVLVVLGAV